MTDIASMLEDAKQWQMRIQARQPKATSWYEVKNAAADVATVRIYDEIGGWGVEADTFAADLEDITASTIEVQINSPGGSVFAGLAIYNALRTHPARIVTRVDGLAASAASFIAQAGDERVMVESSQMMIHDAMCISFGSAADHREAAEFCERQSANIAALYASRSEREPSEFAALMAVETWMTAEEAVEHGLADRVLKPERQTSNKLSTDGGPSPLDVSAAADTDTAESGERAAYLRKLQIRKIAS